MSKQAARARRWLVALVAGAVVLGAVIAPDAASAAGPHRAAVIVETGNDTHRVVITFGEDSISGIEALQRAGADPVVYSFNGQGGAVCRLYGVGRDADSNCLGGQDGDSRYWAYFRAPAGTSKFTYSSVCACTARVHDGDVEGWRFGTGDAPQYVSLQTLDPPPPPATSPPPTGGTNPAASNPTSAGASPTGTGPVAGAPTSSSTLPVTGASGASGARGSGGSGAATGKGDGATTAREPRSGGSPRRADATGAALAASTKDDESSAASLLWFALALVAIVIAIVVIRRVRRGPRAST